MDSLNNPQHSGTKPRSKLPTLKSKEAKTHPATAPINVFEKPRSGSPGSSRLDIQNFRLLTMKRRSKSTTDLRSFSQKPVKGGCLGSRVNLPIKPTKEQPVPVENKEHKGAAKPNATRIKKIPDWDYKSRFLELQHKYTNVAQELKNLRGMVSKLPELEENLQKATQNSAELERVNFVLIKERDTLQFEKTKIEREKAQLEFKHSAHTKKMQQELKNANERLEWYQKQLDHEETQRRILHNTIQDLKGNIRVFCRVRPPITAEEQSKLQCSIQFPDECTLVIGKTRESVGYLSRSSDLTQEFNFDRVFPPQAQQAEVFEELAQLVQSALDGYHVCVFAYGQTGAGKTYTMEGTPENNGMIPRTIDLIFDKINTLERSGWHYNIAASFLEIYNENIRDLLEPNSALSYEPKFNEGRGVTVQNLKTITIESAQILKSVLEESQKNRATATTDFNLRSSRSHSITKINLKGQNQNTNVSYSGSIHLVDLAGSESAKTSTDQRLTETKNINKSLTELGKVMLALQNKERHVPYRNSKLTFLLQSCLGGNSKTLMFVNIAPFEDTFSESVNSLRFASKVKEVKIKLKKNKTYASTSA